MTCFPPCLRSNSFRPVPDVSITQVDNDAAAVASQLSVELSVKILKGHGSTHYSSLAIAAKIIWTKFGQKFISELISFCLVVPFFRSNSLVTIQKHG